jgi:L-threonylcarbamoyladenylate synthase
VPTEVIPVDACHPESGVLVRATAVLRRGGLVAFPTETVYGLGGNALSVEAVHKIFAAKGRPATNPLIVHIASIDAALPLVQVWPKNAQLLAERFWPGPLTVIVPKSARVPDIVTGGGSTVALRMPAHRVALELLEACGLPLAAPSANRSSELSPTQGQHVLRSLDGRIDLLLDAGATPGGIESTVVDLTSPSPRLLRPGLISVAQIEDIVGPIVHETEMAVDAGQTLPSPGMLARHYAPRTPLELAAGTGRERVIELSRQGNRVGWVTFHAEEPLPGVTLIRLADDPAGYAAQLYAALHQLDDSNLTHIVVAEPPDAPPWLAIRDRLRRAAHG